MIVFVPSNLRLPTTFAERVPPHPAWSVRFRLDGTLLTIKVWTHRNAASEIETWRGQRILASQEDGVYEDDSVRPLLGVDGHTALLAYAAFPGAGSGTYASIWKITRRGWKVEQLGLFRNADLRQWFSHGMIREMRPAKYATDDLWRALPNLWQDSRYVDKQFILRYRYDRAAERFRYAGFRAVTWMWPDAIRFPGR